MSNTIGLAYRVTSFGESHGACVGVVVDGCPAGHRVSLESPFGKLESKVTLRQGIRPDTLLIAGQFGQWAMPVAKDTERVTLSSLIPIDPGWTDPVVGVQQGFSTKVKVTKV